MRISDRDEMEILCLALVFAFFLARAAHAWYARRVASRWVEDFRKKQGPYGPKDG